MFATTIDTTAFTERGTETAFKVRGDNVYDAVFMSVMRAVLSRRMGDEILKVRSSEIRLNADSLDEGVMSRIFGDPYAQSDTVMVLNISNQDKIDERLFEKFEELYCTEECGFSRIKRITEFFNKIFDCRVYVCESRRVTTIIIGRMTAMKIHYFTCVTFALFPWYFADKNVTKEEMELMQSLRQKDPVVFLKCLQQFESQFDLYSIKLQGLAGFETAWMSGEIDTINSNISSYNREIENLMSKIADYMKAKQEKQMKLLGIRAAMESEGGDELKDFLLAMRNQVYVTRSDEYEMQFETMSELKYWDSDYAETLYKNKKSILYTARGSQPRLKAKEMAELFKAIFIDERFKLQMCACYTLNPRDCRVHAESGHSYSDRCAAFFPNTHIDTHSCLGGYASAILRFMETHNYIGAVQQCIVSCESLNLQEEPTMTPFFKNLYNTSKPVIMTDTGELLTPAEAAKLLMPSEKKEENKDE